MVFPVVMYGCESWTVKEAGRQRIDAFELWKTPESGESKQIKPVNLKGNQPWILIGRTDAETHLKLDETPVFWSSVANSQLTGKDPDAGKDWGQKEKRASEDEVAAWQHQCNGRELGQTSRDGEDREAWHAAVHGVAKSWTWLGDRTTIANDLQLGLQKLTSHSNWLGHSYLLAYSIFFTCLHLAELSPTLKVSPVFSRNPLGKLICEDSNYSFDSIFPLNSKILYWRDHISPFLVC